MVGDQLLGVPIFDKRTCGLAESEGSVIMTSKTNKGIATANVAIVVQYFVKDPYAKLYIVYDA